MPSFLGNYMLITIQVDPVSRAATPQVFPFTVPSSTEERPAATSSAGTWDELVRGIQTSRIDPSNLTASNLSDTSGLPSHKVLRQAWPRLMHYLRIKF
jgi:hypothetical protein